MKKKPTNNQYPIHELLHDRWSTVCFDDRAIESDKIRSLLEAARWSASCFNEQPWSFIIATKEDSEEYDRLLSCIVEANQKWAKNAPLLMISVAKHNFEKNGKPNRHAFHDVGLAVANMTIQAQAFGLFVHQMGGFDVEKATQLYAIPEGYEPVAAIAIGYLGNLENLPEDLQQRELSQRIRKPLESLLFTGKWGNVSPLIDR
jgi:nitroreductase